MQTRFTSKQAAELCGIPYATVTFLRARGLVTPSIRVGGNKGAASVYDVYDVALLKCLAELRAVPSTFDTMMGVIKCCGTAGAKAVIDANRFGGHVEVPVPDTPLLVIKADGTAELARDCKVSELFGTAEAAKGAKGADDRRPAVVLHIVDLARLARAVSMDVTTLQIVEGNAVPGPKGRLPLVGRKKNMKRRGEKKRGPSPEPSGGRAGPPAKPKAEPTKAMRTKKGRKS